MPKDMTPEALAVGPRGGYIDCFEIEWVPVKGQHDVMRWLEYLSERGRLSHGQLGTKHELSRRRRRR